VRAHPTDEHLQPLLVAIGAAGEDWARAERLDGGLVYGVIGMDSYLFGSGSVATHFQPAGASVAAAA